MGLTGMPSGQHWEERNASILVRSSEKLKILIVGPGRYPEPKHLLMMLIGSELVLEKLVNN